MNRPIVEVCSNSLRSSLEAQYGGADRVELCASIPEGGTTPSYGEIVCNRKSLQIKLNVIIRLRGGDFLYSADELTVMEEDIRMCERLGVDGVVFGVLTPDGEIDIAANSRLIEAAGSMNKTFHRAFDMCRDSERALEEIISLGFDTVLTSGGAASAELGTAQIAQLVRQAAGRIMVMPGCGITATNISEIQHITGAGAYHFSARSSVESGMKQRNPNVSMGGVVKIEEYSYNYTDRMKVSEIIKKLR
ncbi:MAG: copper homeostasis protein CutC [Rikenellaceae bacterium]